MELTVLESICMFQNIRFQSSVSIIQVSPTQGSLRTKDCKRATSVKVTFWRRHGEQSPTERRIRGRPRLGLDVAHHPPRGRGPGLGRVEGLRRLLPLQQPVQAHQLLRLPPQQRRLSFESMCRWTILRCIKWLRLLSRVAVLKWQCQNDNPVSQ